MSQINKLSGLAKVQNLYVMQMELWNLLKGGIVDSARRQEAQKRLREFARLLQDADWRYMGGEDVYASLEGVRKRMVERLEREKKVVGKKKGRR